MRKKIYKSSILILSLLCILSVIASISYAYFSSDLNINGYANLKIELLFDKFDEDALKDYQEQFTGLTNADKEEWGHKGNPYVISEERHVSNLSVLQNIGYFYNNFIVNNYDTNGNLITDATKYSDGYDVPYFVIAKPNGSPTVIDVSKRTIKPVGNDAYPFIGSVTGVSVNTKDDNLNNDADASFLVSSVDNTSNRLSSTSGIHGITVKTTQSAIDYGFFGKVSYLGDEENNISGEDQAPSFKGFVSNISNILFSDVKIVVRDTVWDSIVEFFNKHLFYKNTVDGGDLGHRDPCETHHIGIVVGHAEYVKMSSISVYYSSLDVTAFDLKDAGKDENGKPFSYVSSTGYLGFMYNLNPEITNNKITVGSGIDSAEISYGYQGGGGLSSGILPGYIRAEQMYDLYSEEGYTEKLVLINAKDSEGNPLAIPVENATSTNYYFTDGVFTFAFSPNPKNGSDVNSLDTIEDIWKTKNVDKIRLAKGNDWEIGPGEEGLYYYQKLELVTGTIDTSYQYLIGYLEEQANGGNIFYIMNLTASSSGTAAKENITIMPSESGENENQLSISYPVDDTNFKSPAEGYAVKFTKSGNNYQISSAVDNSIYLGLKKTLGGVLGNSIYYGEKQSSGFVSQYSYDATLNYTGSAWEITINGSKIDFNGENFTVDFWETSGSTAIPIQIYKILDGEYKSNANDAYNPKNNEAERLPANQYVFYPTTSTSGGTKKLETKYEVLSLQSLGWKTGDSAEVWATDENGKSVINKMFNIKKSVNWGLAATFGNFGVDLGSGDDGMIVAPVGTGSYQRSVYLPTGSLAFNINKITGDYATIKVIVKVPHTNTVGGLGLDGTDNDHFIGIWKGTEKTSSWFSFATFSEDGAIQKVELPRSQRLIDDNGNAYDATEQYITAYYGHTNKGEYTEQNKYYTLLQGGYYLLAYEFKVAETGLYILAASSNINMQLAYCRVEGVASVGRDGSGGSILGNIDFVYDNGEKVLLVTDVQTVQSESTENGGTENVGEDPTKYYYESFILVHFTNVDDDMKLHVINNEMLSIYRWVGGDEKIKTNLGIEYTSGLDDCEQSNCAHVKGSQIKSITDNLALP